MKCYIDKRGYNIIFRAHNRTLINFVDIETGVFYKQSSFYESLDEYICDISDDLYNFIEKLYATNN